MDIQKNDMSVLAVLSVSIILTVRYAAGSSRMVEKQGETTGNLTFCKENDKTDKSDMQQINRRNRWLKNKRKFPMKSGVFAFLDVLVKCYCDAIWTPKSCCTGAPGRNYYSEK